MALDLKHIADTVVNLQKKTVAGPAFIGLIAEAQVSPDTRTAFLAEFADRRREITRQGPAARDSSAVNCGPNTDIDLVIDVIGGATTFRLLQGHAPLNEKVHQRSGRSGVGGLPNKGVTNMIRPCTSCGHSA